MVEKLIKDYENEHGKCTKYSDNMLREIAVNCISLSNTWYDRVKRGDGKCSFEIVLYGKDGSEFDVISGLTRESTPAVILNIVLNMNDKVSKLSLKKFKYTGEVKASETLGSMDIS